MQKNEAGLLPHTIHKNQFNQRPKLILQYSCLENPMDRAAWWAASIGSQSDTTEVSQHTHTQ